MAYKQFDNFNDLLKTIDEATGNVTVTRSRKIAQNQDLAIVVERTNRNRFDVTDLSVYQQRFTINIYYKDKISEMQIDDITKQIEDVVKVNTYQANYERELEFSDYRNVTMTGEEVFRDEVYKY
ncbi:MAG: hypothetical protein ACRCZK_01695 [Oscillospiraceae bacterium]